MDLSSKKLVFVSGKGGVGKSVCAAAIAWRLTCIGKRVCLIELGSQSFYESFFQTRGITYEPSEVIRDVHIAMLTPESSLREYVLTFLKVPKLYDLFFQNKVMKAFINAAPAIAELAILGKLTSDIRGIIKTDYDVFVVDCYSTGHALALFRAPQGLSATFKSGPLYEQSRDIANVLKRPEVTHYVLATLAEEMPVAETTELYNSLKEEFNADVTVVCNNVVQPPLTRSELDALEAETSDKKMLEFIEYLKFKTKIQGEQLVRLKALAPGFFAIPQIFKSGTGQEYVEAFAKHLEKPWESTSS